MLIEKLMLQLLIILLPNFILHVFFENKRIGQSPYLIAGMHALSLFFCMMFAYYDYGLFWDLRYVPLVLACIQGGPVAGAIVFISYLATRTYLGGDALLFGYMSGILAFSVPFVYTKKYWNRSWKINIPVSVLLGVWPTFVMLLILVAYIWTEGVSVENGVKVLTNVALFGILQVASVWFATRINDMFVDRRRMKNEISRTEKLNTMGELAASIAHEIRNPLTVVKGFLQLMQKKEKNENFQYLSLVLSELGRAESIINDYLNFAKPQFEKIEQLNLKDLLQEVQFLLHAMAMQNGVELVSELDEEVYLKTDRDQLKQVIVNLMKNAIEATPPGGKVTNSLKKEMKDSIIKISDTGKGMSAEELSRIGTLFYTTKDIGTGLGTSVSLRIIEKMNGEITFKSEPRIGTEVRIRLPAS